MLHNGKDMNSIADAYRRQRAGGVEERRHIAAYCWTSVTLVVRGWGFESVVCCNRTLSMGINYLTLLRSLSIAIAVAIEGDMAEDEVD